MVLIAWTGLVEYIFYWLNEVKKKNELTRPALTVIMPRNSRKFSKFVTHEDSWNRERCTYIISCIYGFDYLHPVEKKTLERWLLASSHVPKTTAFTIYRGHDVNRYKYDTVVVQTTIIIIIIMYTRIRFKTGESIINGRQTGNVFRVSHATRVIINRPAAQLGAFLIRLQRIYL